MATTTKTGAKTAPAKAESATKKSEKSVAKPKNKTGKMEDSEFHKFFVDELKDIYWAEKHLAKALPKFKKAATSPELAATFDKHTAETQSHVETLDQIFGLLDEKASAKKCEAMAGLLEEAEGIIEETEEGTMIRDAGLILAAQKVEHYEIATYGTLKVFAENMGHTEVANLLAQTLENEKATDVALTEVAENFINQNAASE
ncbi:YciE/YciF ferroxidase family protein [Pedobacter mucosus]|uniref:YciE/YciF ferroxidase family protein n=1 Tax=Pedobacter mucosus TaxID=2895286 RepID=UPI001EE4103F|nr:ferritin-like domain-containing protein [Pedobacter mucosus]UKT65246.1 ferritin-like domain-containing protein [Pedobacter mucosus]